MSSPSEAGVAMMDGDHCNDECHWVVNGAAQTAVPVHMRYKLATRHEGGDDNGAKLRDIQVQSEVAEVKKMDHYARLLSRNS